MKSQLMILTLLIVCSGLFAQAEWQWATAITSTQNVSVDATVTDNQYNSYIAGHATAATFFGTDSLTASGAYSFVAKLDNSGSWQWKLPLYTHNQVTVGSICHDNENNIYLAGEFTTDIWSAGLDTVSTASAYPDIFVLKLSPAGTIQWFRTFTSPYYKTFVDMSCDAQGNCYVLGFFHTTLQYMGNNISSGTGSDYFIAKLTNTGAMLWGRDIHTGVDFVGIETSPGGDSYLYGTTTHPTPLDELNIVNSGQNNADVVLAKLNTNDVWQWATVGTDMSYSFANLLACNDNNQFLITAESGALPDVPASAQPCRLPDDLWMAKLNNTGNATNWLERSTALGEAHCIALDNDNNAYFGVMADGIAQYGDFSFFSCQIETAVVKYNNQNQWEWLLQPTTDLPPQERAQSLQCLEEGNVLFCGQFTRLATFGDYTLTSAGGNTTYQAFIAKGGTNVTAVHDETILPTVLVSCYPNPIRSTATFRLSLPKAAPASLQLFNVKGQLVQELPLTKGQSSVNWDGTNLHHQPCPNGMYYYRLTTGGHSSAGKVLLLR